MGEVLAQIHALDAQRRDLADARAAELSASLADLWQRPAQRPGDRMCPELAELILLTASVSGPDAVLRLLDWLPPAPGESSAVEAFADLLCDFGGFPSWRGPSRFPVDPRVTCLGLIVSPEVFDQLFEVCDAA